MMDDAAFYACNSMVSDRFLLTTAFNLVFTRPLKHGPVMAEGRWVSGRRRVFVGEALAGRLPDGEEAAREHRHVHAFAHPSERACRRLFRRRFLSDQADQPLRCLSTALLHRRAQSARAGFDAVLAKGDATAGAIAVILAERGARKACFLERVLQPDGAYSWQASIGQIS